MRRLGPIVGCLLLAACSNAAADGPGSLRRGQAALAAGEPRLARVELLNAIQADPDNAAARILQARTLLMLEEGVAAEAELRRAEQLGVPRARLAALLAEAVLLQGRADEALALAADGAANSHVRGRALARLGRIDEAGQAYSAALLQTPDDPRLWLDIARLRREAGDIGGAIAAADRSVALKPDFADALGLRGELTRGQYGLRAALPWFDRAIAIDPKDPIALLERAATHADLGQAGAALADTRAALAVREDHPVAFYIQALIAARARQWELAARLYRRTGGRLDGMPNALLLAAAIELETGDAGAAARRLERLARLQPDNRKALRLLGLARLRMADPERAIGALRGVADANDADGWTQRLIAEALARKGDRRAAAAYRDGATRPSQGRSTLLAPAEGDPQVAEIRGALTRGDAAAAIAGAEALIAARPGSPDGYLLLGDALGVAGDFGSAAQAYQRAANLSFTEPVALRLVEALDRSGSGAAATRAAQLFLHQNPGNLALLRLAADRHMAARQWRPAIAAYERIRLRLGNRDAILLNNLAWAWAELGDYGRALPLARRAWALDPANAATADTFGWLLYRSGADRAQGLALLQRARNG